MLDFRAAKGSLNAPIDLTVAVRDASGRPVPAVGGFDSAPALVCRVWAGDDRAPACELPAAWLDAPSAKLRVTLDRTMIDALDVGRWRAVVTVAASGQAVAEFGLKVEAGPGSAPPLPTYCEAADLTDVLPWLTSLADQTEDQAGFAEARAEAREWIDRTVLAAVPTPRVRSRRGFASDSFDTLGPAAGRALRARYEAALAADLLDVASPSGRGFVRVAIDRAIAFVLRRAAGSSAVGGGGDLRKTAAFHAARAEYVLVGLRADFDVSTGLPSLDLATARPRS